MNFLTTVTGSYPRKEVQKDTLRKPTVSEQEALEMVRDQDFAPSDVAFDAAFGDDDE